MQLNRKILSLMREIQSCNRENNCRLLIGWTSQAVKELAVMPKGSRAIVSICADGGLGTVALLEN
jgi:hypothetical protein